MNRREFLRGAVRLALGVATISIPLAERPLAGLGAWVKIPDLHPGYSPQAESDFRRVMQEAFTQGGRPDVVYMGPWAFDMIMRHAGQ